MPVDWFSWPLVQVNGQWLSPLSYRWLNALVGSTLPILSALLAFYLSLAYSYPRRLGFSLLAGVLVALSGLTLVESRLALINLYWVWFGLLGQLCWVIAQGAGRKNQSEKPRGLTRSWSVAAGVCLGAAMNVKWNGAGFWLGLVLLEVILKWRIVPAVSKPGIRWNALALYLGAVPLLTYGVLWIPHLWLNQVSLIEMHRQLWVAHRAIGDAVDPHPYCSAWYTWPLMLRPVSYFYKPIDGWLTTAAVVALGAWWISRWWRKIGEANGVNRATWGVAGSTCPTVAGISPVVSFVLVNYAANWLPWIVVNRCTFLYHALGMVIFAAVASAWLWSRWLIDRRWHYRMVAWVMLFTMVWGFWFWLPVFLGLPLSPEALQQRWWLKSWI